MLKIYLKLNISKMKSIQFYSLLSAAYSPVAMMLKMWKWSMLSSLISFLPMRSFSDVNLSFWYVATNYLTEICFERLDSPRHKVVNSPAYDGVVEHSHVDVDHTDSVTNLGKRRGEDGSSKIKANNYASPLSKLDRSSSKEIGSHIWLKHVIPIFIYQPC